MRDDRVGLLVSRRLRTSEGSRYSPRPDGRTSTTLRYDPLLRLYGVASSVPNTSGYDGSDLIFEHDDPGALTHRYVHGPGTGEPLVKYYLRGGTVQRFWLHADERGSTIAVSDAAGDAFTINASDEYGNYGGGWGRFLYTGQAFINDTDILYNYKARVYSPKLGRFLQADPIGYGDGMNLYGYVGGDPVNATDPSGTECTGSRIADNCAEGGGIANGRSPSPRLALGSGGGGGLSGGSYEFTPGKPTFVDPKTNNIVVTGGFYRWMPSFGGTSAQLLPYQGPPLGGNPAECADAACSEVIVTVGTPNTRWILEGSRWVPNSNYVRPWYATPFEYGTAAVFAGPLALMAGAEATAAAPAVGATLFAQRIGLLNRNNFFRVGWGTGKHATRSNYYITFRIGTGKAYGPNHRHIDIPGTRRVP